VILFREIITVYSDNHIKPISFLNVKACALKGQHYFNELGDFIAKSPLVPYTSTMYHVRDTCSQTVVTTKPHSLRYWKAGSSETNLTPEISYSYKFFLVILSPSIQIPRQYLKSGHDRFLPHPLQFIIRQ
jgi:hypothetical protein